MHRGGHQAFESFVPGPASAEAFGFATALAEESGGPRLLLLYGPPGVGKTHLLRAILDRVRRRYPAALIAEMTAVELVQHMLGRRDKDLARLEPQPEKADWLVVDDLHVLAGMPITQSEAGRLLMTVVDRGGRVACASGGPAFRIQTLVEAVQRLTAARVVAVGPPRPQEIRRILALHAAAAGLRPSRDTLAALAGQAVGDVRVAMGALARLRFLQGLRGEATR